MKGANVRRIKEGKDDIVFKYVRADYYDIGKTLIKNPYGREVAVYDKERTILDLIKDKNLVDTFIFSEAIKLYFSSNDKDLWKLSKYVIAMKIEDPLRSYTEVILRKGYSRDSINQRIFQLLSLNDGNKPEEAFIVEPNKWIYLSIFFYIY